MANTLSKRTPGADPNVPYDRMAQAELDAVDAHPEAPWVRAMWTPTNGESDVHVEVGSNDASKVSRVWRPGAEPVSV